MKKMRISGDQEIRIWGSGNREIGKGSSQSPNAQISKSRYPNSPISLSWKRGQLTIEYAVMFVAIVAAIIYAAKFFIQPSMNRFFNSTSRVINKSVEEIENRFN